MYNRTILTSRKIFRREERKRQENEAELDSFSRANAVRKLVSAALDGNAADEIEITPHGKVTISFDGLVRLIEVMQAKPEEKKKSVSRNPRSWSRKPKKVVATKDGERLEFPSQMKCAEFFGVNPKTIRAACCDDKAVRGYTVTVG